MCGDWQGQRLPGSRRDRGRRPSFFVNGCAPVHVAACWAAGKEQRGRRRHCSCGFPGAARNVAPFAFRGLCGSFRCPHFVCLPAVCWVGGVFQSPPVDSKVRLHMRQRRRVGAFGSASGRIPCGALGLVPACRAGWDRPGRGAAAHLYVLVTLLCIFWPTRLRYSAQNSPCVTRRHDVIFRFTT